MGRQLQKRIYSLGDDDGWWYWAVRDATPLNGVPARAVPFASGVANSLVQAEFRTNNAINHYMRVLRLEVAREEAKWVDIDG